MTPRPALTEEIEEAARQFANEVLGSYEDSRLSFLAGARFARDRYEARLAEDAKVRAGLVEALRKLRTEINAVLSLAEPTLRGEIGNTNLAVLHDRMDIADAALAAAKEMG